MSEEVSKLSGSPGNGQAIRPRDATAAHGGRAGPGLLRSTSPPDGPEIRPTMPDATDASVALARRAVAVTVRLHLAPVGNRREHHLARARRTRREHQSVLAGLAGCSPPRPPVVVLLVRIGWNRLDVDGLVASMKGVIDAVARWLGVDDRDPRVRWHLAQSVTRERRLSHRTGRWETAAEVRIVARPWQSSDGDDPLRVLAVAPEVRT